MPRWNGKWSGGRTYENRDGETVYWLDKSWNGKRYGFALNVRSKRDAEAELALFLRNPAGYVERLEEKKKAEEEKVIVSAELFDQFCDYLRKLEREERHIRGCRHYLDWWLDQLGKANIRKIMLRDLKRCLKTVTTAKRNRIASWKVFCSFLREEMAILPRGDDASLDLHAPVGRPEKSIREKGYSIERIQQFYSAMLPWKSDRSGWEEKIPDVDKQSLQAAQRLQKRGSAPSDSYVRKVIDRTAMTSHLEPIRFGELRHSFTTWSRSVGTLVRSKDKGVSVEEVAAVLGHTNVRTTRMHYDGLISKLVLLFCSHFEDIIAYRIRPKIRNAPISLRTFPPA